MPQTLICQSCGMPMTTADMQGTNADASSNADYCTYCFQAGAFTQNLTMEQMIHHCTQFVDDANEDIMDQKISDQQATEQMTKYFPLLKRWKK